MSASIIAIISIVLFLVAYFVYSKKLERDWGIDDSKVTPAHRLQDGIDYVPAKAPVLLGHHFASIAGAAPIVGPIAASVFGWVPVLLWILIGNIFFGAVKDFGALFASIRHDSKSIGEIIQKNLGDTGKILFNLFAWLTLLLVVAAFAVITAKTFVSVPAAASSSLMFIVLAVVFGFAVYRSNVPMSIGTVIGVVLLFVCVYLGLLFPVQLSFTTWVYILLAYIFVASITPVWILLQPRDYLNSFLLYAILAGAVIGLFVSSPTIVLSSYTGFKASIGYMFPVLFVTVACGAISGFHSLVSSGTTSKQLDKESDARIIGYGGMLIEGVLAVLALITAAVLAGDKLGELLKAGGPVAVFSHSVGNFLGAIGIPPAAGTSFAALAVSAFALTSLDTATRLGRFIFQELMEMGSGNKGTNNGDTWGSKIIATGVTVVAGGALALSGKWSAIWPIFGSANQLLAALALLAISVWLANIGKNNKATLIPMLFMFAVTLTALVTLVTKNLGAGNILLAVIGAILFCLAIVLGIFGYRVLSNLKETVDVDPTLKQ
ncbi:MAG: carbon starvation protein [Clostridia bacterium]|jgi:carbon starvation protein|nr:carbon starvation protein [Clostridia bacterium]MDN5323450.1 carbon starvation protein [Clostridia bacterium]